ncbi:MAG TPA: GNAT family N-acetyltransferase [Candidatus Binataceae bacterium]|jgi:phosphinothricin acetyltransferase|nr:GNAT family N-acetyltransferase [Candidatus Binataceae bacterium]
MAADITIRPAIRGDLAAITEIYNYFIRNTPITFDVEPYTVETRTPWFDGFAGGGRYRLFVAEQAGVVVAYAGSMPFHHKRAYETSVETTIYCASGMEGRGVGTRLYEALFDAIGGQDIHRAMAGITLPNAASVALHRRFGFTQVALFTENGRKFGRYWDVAWFEKPFGGTS